MINAAVVGLGTWGKTMVESLAGGSDLMRFTTLQTRTVTPDVEAFAKQHSLRIANSYEAVLADPKIDAVALATPPSGHLQQIEAAAAAGKHVYCEKPFTFSKKEAEAAVDAVRKAKRVVGVGYNRRFHPEMVKLHDRIRGRRTRHHPAHRSQHDLSQRAVPAADGMAREQVGSAAGRPRADGRARDRRMIDLCGAIDHVYCQSFAPRGEDRHRRHDVDAVPHEGRHVGLSRHHDHDRRGLQLPGVRLQGLAAA